MTNLIPVLVLLSVVVVSLLVVRVATVALTLTGVSKDVARFEARSAFTGSGYTTKQTELIMGHPVRRRIVLTLMLLGSAGHVTVISSLIFSVFGGSGGGNAIPFLATCLRIVAILAGLGLLWIIGTSEWIDRQTTRVITQALKRFTDIELIDYVGLLRISGGYEVAELLVNSQSWLVDKSLSELRLTDENVLILGVHRPDGQYIGTPPHNYILRESDNLIIYGPKAVIQDIDSRPSGEEGQQAHLESVRAQNEADDGSAGSAIESLSS